MLYSNDCWLKGSCKAYNTKCSDKESKFCIKLFKLDELYKNSLLTLEQRKNIQLYVEDSDSYSYNYLNNIKNNILDFVNSGKNLYLYSNICGNGKTAWAIKLMQNYFNKIWPRSSLSCRGLFINVPRFLLSLKDNISVKSDYISHIKQNVLSADLVVWDDIATKSITDFESEHLLSMIDTRMNDKKSNIFTSNIGMEELYDLVGARLASRIFNFSDKIQLFGNDKREFSRRDVE